MENSVETQGKYKGQRNAQFVFELENGDVLDFDIYDDRILRAYNLFSSLHVNSQFSIEYEEILDESISFELIRLEKLE